MVGSIIAFIVLVTAIATGGAMVLVSIGAIGLVGITLAASLVPYRRSVFRSSNPYWDATVHGGLSEYGLRIKRAGAESYFRWGWFDGGVIGERIVALIPSLHPHQPILISASMLSNLNDWDRITAVVRCIGIAADDSSTHESRRHDNRLLIRSRRRGRSVDLPDDAIAFEGIFSTRDLRLFPAAAPRRIRPMRAYLMMTGLVIFASTVLVGIAWLGGLGRLAVPIMIGVYGIAFFLRPMIQRIRDANTGGHPVCYLTAFANDLGITSDFGVTVTVVPWGLMQLASVSDDAIAISRRDARQFVVARRDMFESDPVWQNFRTLVDQKLKAKPA